MTLKELIINNNISVYKLSKEANIPYTTLNELVLEKKNINDCNIKTIKSIAGFFNISIDDLLDKLNNNTEQVLSNSWEQNRNKRFIFPNLIEKAPYHNEYIYPLMQKTVFNVYNNLKGNYKISKIILFGSSTNIRCTHKSDLDFAIMIKDEYFDLDTKNEISEIIQNSTNFNSDIIWLNTIDVNTKLYENINKGVVIYE